MYSIYVRSGTGPNSDTTLNWDLGCIFSNNLTFLQWYHVGFYHNATGVTVINLCYVFLLFCFLLIALFLFIYILLMVC